jgi:hypothetical protein
LHLFVVAAILFFSHDHNVVFIGCKFHRLARFSITMDDNDSLQRGHHDTDVDEQQPCAAVSSSGAHISPGAANEVEEESSRRDVSPACTATTSDWMDQSLKSSLRRKVLSPPPGAVRYRRPHRTIGSSTAATITTTATTSSPMPRGRRPGAFPSASYSSPSRSPPRTSLRQAKADISGSAAVAVSDSNSCSSSNGSSGHHDDDEETVVSFEQGLMIKVNAADLIKKKVRFGTVVVLGPGIFFRFFLTTTKPFFPIRR